MRITLSKYFSMYHKIEKSVKKKRNIFQHVLIGNDNLTNALLNKAIITHINGTYVEESYK